jgi:predicted tellurium resistance membrane protein TerC
LLSVTHISYWGKIPGLKHTKRIISEFLDKYPALKIIALAFIFMVGIILLADGVHLHIEKAYLYFSLFFTLAVESLNIAARKRK